MSDTSAHIKLAEERADKGSGYLNEFGGTSQSTKSADNTRAVQPLNSRRNLVLTNGAR